VTGAGRGTGRALTRLLAERGGRIVLAELDRESGRGLEQELRRAGREVLFVETDVRDESSVEAAVDAAIDRYGALHQMALCAGGSLPEDGPVTEADLSILDHSLAVDLRGTVLACRHGIPRIIESGGGAIVTFGSIVALRGGFAQHMYSAAKGAVLSLTRSLAGRYGRDGVRVNAVCPGLVLSERLIDRVAVLGEEHLEDPASAAPLVGLPDHPFSVGTPRDMAEIVAFLLSDAARMIHGAVVPAEGGLSAY
jgi:NAD(P)-dependent dehydrogenase (short-subunit alcohol dehydrogenase family)